MIKNKHLARTLELKRQSQQSTSATAMAVNNVEQKDLLRNVFHSSSSPKPIGLMQMDNHSPSGIPSPLSSLYNSSTPSPSASYYPSGYPHQRTASPAYRPSSLQYDSSQTATGSFHDPNPRVKTPVFEEFLTPPPSYTPVHNPLLSVHSYMNVSFQDPTNNSTTMTTSSSFNHHLHHSTTYPY